MFKNKFTKTWLITSIVIFVLALAITIAATVTPLYGLICIVLGRERGIIAGGREQVYVGEYSSKDEARKAGEKLNEEVAGEGFVLLKNENALPLAENSKISVFGKNSVNLVYGGSGSGGGTHDNAITIEQSLKNAGFSVNDKLVSFYSSSASGNGRTTNPAIESGGVNSLDTGETPQSSYTSEVKSSYKNFNDAAIIVISRIGGEGWDLPRLNGLAGNAANSGDHYLRLDKNEKDLINAVCSEDFKNVIILLNTNNPLELGFLDDPNHYAYNSKINACLWIGTPGDTGINALGKILKNEICPSGRTVDTFSRNFENDPVWQNFGNNNVDRGQYYTVGGKANISYSFVDYEEDIYVGYRYFETRGEIEGETWYKDNVVYPFGYGLSYASFEQTIVDKGNVSITSDPFTVKVRVTNTSTNVSGKDVVEIYANPPYTNGGIEKSSTVLAGFAKTKVLAPGESEVISVSVDPYSFSSYSKDDGCFVLDSGNYKIRIAKNAHETIDYFEGTVSSKIKFDEDKVENRYNDASDPTQLKTIMSRSNFESTYPSMRTAEEKNLSTELKAKLDDRNPNNPIKVSAADYPVVSSGGETKFEDVIGKEYDDPIWEDLLDCLSIEEMTALVTDGQFKTATIQSIGLPATVDADGPFGFVNFMGDPTVYGCCYYCSEVVIASTWNVELSNRIGIEVGNESIIGNEAGDGLPYSGWYAPAINIHRSPFGGRLGEYYSEDPLISGKMAANLIKGARTKGLMTYIKHFAVNEQETSRNGIATWLSEQALREIYLKPFEIAVKEGKSIAMMSSFNRIGAVWTGGDFRLLTEILRNEWGFRGLVVCDYNSNNEYMNARQMVYAGGDLHLFTATSVLFKPSVGSATDITILRTCAKNIIYAVANSNITDCNIIGYNPPVWEIVLFIVDGALLAIIVVWGIFAIKKGLKK